MNTFHVNTQVKLYRVANLMLGREQDFFKAFEITQKQFNILRILRGVYPASIALKTISERMIERSSDVTRLTSRLVKKGLIQVSTNSLDKRYRDASITKTGMHLLAQIDAVALERMKTGIQHLSREECHQLSTLLDKIAGEEEISDTVIVKE